MCTMKTMLGVSIAYAASDFKERHIGLYVIKDYEIEVTTVSAFK